MCKRGVFNKSIAETKGLKRDVSYVLSRRPERHDTSGIGERGYKGRGEGGNKISTFGSSKKKIMHTRTLTPHDKRARDQGFLEGDREMTNASQRNNGQQHKEKKKRSDHAVTNYKEKRRRWQNDQDLIKPKPPPMQQRTKGTWRCCSRRAFLKQE